MNLTSIFAFVLFSPLFSSSLTCAHRLLHFRSKSHHFGDGRIARKYSGQRNERCNQLQYSWGIESPKTTGGVYDENQKRVNRPGTSKRGICKIVQSLQKGAFAASGPRKPV